MEEMLGVIGWDGWNGWENGASFGLCVVRNKRDDCSHHSSTLLPLLSPPQPNSPLFHSTIVATYIQHLRWGSYPSDLIPTSPHLTSPHLTNARTSSHAMLCTLHRHSSKSIVDRRRVVSYHTIPYYIIPDHEVVCFYPGCSLFRYNTIQYFSRKPW